MYTHIVYKSILILNNIFYTQNYHIKHICKLNRQLSLSFIFIKIPKRESEIRVSHLSIRWKKINEIFY